MDPIQGLGSYTSRVHIQSPIAPYVHLYSLYYGPSIHNFDCSSCAVHKVRPSCPNDARSLSPQMQRFPVQGSCLSNMFGTGSKLGPANQFECQVRSIECQSCAKSLYRELVHQWLLRRRARYWRCLITPLLVLSCHGGAVHADLRVIRVIRRRDPSHCIDP